MKGTEKTEGTSLANALSVDVEDYFHVEAFSDKVATDDWDSYPSRVVNNTRRVLDLLARHSAKATFFILGWVAEREPSLVREIQSGGHEIGCHSHLHRPLWKLDPKEFRRDTLKARMVIEEAAGECISGYRAPTFSVVSKTLWAIEILAEEGFRYDSSVFPTMHDTYGMPGMPRFAFQWLSATERRLLEVPPTTVRLAGRNFAAGGGGYLRLLPMMFTEWALERVVNEDQPLNLYLHPWELDPQQPRISGGLKSKLRHYTNLNRMADRLAQILDKYRFVSIREVLAERKPKANLQCVSVGENTSVRQES
jgi:polysaccharide deacetylase family protein (PEP-CTERM system associated)